MNLKNLLLLSCLILTLPLFGQHSVARMWNEVLLDAIRGDFARPTVHARNLFHTSMAMYDAWAVFDEEAETVFLGKSFGTYTCPFDGFISTNNPALDRQEAISYAAYRILTYRFRRSPGAVESLERFDNLMDELGYDRTLLNTDYQNGSAAALGNYIAEQILDFGLQDGSNERLDYANRYYFPVNPPMAPTQSGNANLFQPNRWQPLTFDVFVDQSGNVVPGAAPAFQSPEWGRVVPFALQPENLDIYRRFGNEYWVYHDPGDPCYIESDGSGLSAEYKWGFALVAMWTAQLDPADGVLWDISPASIGNIDTLPTTIEGLRDFYDEFEGGDPSRGHTLNPHTGEPYPPNIVPRADYARVLAEFWADGPDSETPPGHWYTILNYVNDHPDLEKRFQGKGTLMDDLEWDVKTYLALGGAVHDAAISAWGVKGWYDYLRPISAIRFMAEMGQSTDQNLPSYHPMGIPLVEGYIELVAAGDELAGRNNENAGKIKLYTWRGPDYIDDPDTDYAGVGWILAADWWPYQRPTFVTPPFAGYVSGHSTFSRAAAEVLTLFTGDEFFPSGVGIFEAKKNEFLVFEEGPSVDINLQWATYRDASDQTSLSRIWGGIHPPIDDIPGRLIGEKVGVDAFYYARNFFYQDKDNDGFFSFEDCDDNNAMVNPSLSEFCDGLDNNCDGQIDEGLSLFAYYFDEDGDGFGDPEMRLDTCLSFPPENYVTNNADCSVGDPNINPEIQEICDEVDNNCDRLVDENLPLFTYYLDSDDDGFGDRSIPLITCLNMVPTGYVVNALDCNDGNAQINPTTDEICDDIDNNCNGLIDDGLTFYNYYIDRDGDGFGDEKTTARTCFPFPPEGYVANSTDCNDEMPNINPGATDIPDNRIDEDCSGYDLVEATRIFPNPTTNRLHLHKPYEGNARVELFDVMGRLVYEERVAFLRGVVTINIQNLPANIYYIKVKAPDGEDLIVDRVIKL